MLTKLIPIIGSPVFVITVLCLTVGLTSFGALGLGLWGECLYRYSHRHRHDWFGVLPGVVAGIAFGFVIALWIICAGILKVLSKLEPDYFLLVAGILAIMFAGCCFLLILVVSPRKQRIRKCMNKEE
jgi:hypothetical protein